MKAFEEIQQLWNDRQEDPKVDFDLLMKHVKGSRKSLTARFLWQCVGIVVALVILFVMVVLVDFMTWTAYAGIWIIVSCLIYYLVNQLRDYRSLERSDVLFAKPQEYIEYLKDFKQRRNRFNTYNYAVYEGCVALALALYSIEFYYMLPTLVFVLFAGFVVIWFLITHFVFRRKYIKNENERIETMVGHLQRIAKQFEAE